MPGAVIAAHGVGRALLAEIRNWSRQTHRHVKIVPDYYDKPYEGKRAIIRFSPGLKWTSHGGSDVALFHELVHASRSIRSVRFDVRDVPVDQDYGDQDEYLAIVLANIYLSEKTKGNTKFRPNHLSAPPGGTVLTMSSDEFSNLLYNTQGVDMSPVRLMENFRLTQRSLYDLLVRLPKDNPKFNLVKQYEERREWFLHAWCRPSVPCDTGARAAVP